MWYICVLCGKARIQRQRGSRFQISPEFFWGDDALYVSIFYATLTCFQHRTIKTRYKGMIIRDDAVNIFWVTMLWLVSSVFFSFVLKKRIDFEMQKEIPLLIRVRWQIFAYHKCGRCRLVFHWLLIPMCSLKSYCYFTLHFLPLPILKSKTKNKTKMEICVHRTKTDIFQALNW